MKGKKLSYIPALSVIIVFCALFVGGFIYLCVKDISKTGKTYKQIEDLKKQKSRLDNERANIKNTVNADQSYQEYFRQWESIEGEWNSGRVLSKLNELAEQVGVRVFDSSVSDGADAASSNMEAPSAEFNGRSARGPMPSRLGGRLPRPSTPSAPSMDNSKVGAVDLVLLGEFNSLMNWISQIENSIGSARVTKTTWTARSSEEVRLSVTVQYRKFR